MEFDAHIEHMSRRLESMTAARNRLAEASNKKSLKNLYGIMSPELYRAERACIAELGGAALDLVKLTPHLPEIYGLYRESKKA